MIKRSITSILIKRISRTGFLTLGSFYYKTSENKLVVVAIIIVIIMDANDIVHVFKVHVTINKNEVADSALSSSRFLSEDKLIIV